MKNNTIIKKLGELRNSHIEIIDLKNERNYTCGVALNYSELINRIADLLKTSKKALDGLYVAEESYITDPEINVADVLGIVIKLLPFAEMKFIDEVVGLLDEVNNTIEK